MLDIGNGVHSLSRFKRKTAETKKVSGPFLAPQRVIKTHEGGGQKGS
jgi:hypothetical protein